MRGREGEGSGLPSRHSVASQGRSRLAPSGDGPGIRLREQSGSIEFGSGCHVHGGHIRAGLQEERSSLDGKGGLSRSSLDGWRSLSRARGSDGGEGEGRDNSVSRGSMLATVCLPSCAPDAEGADTRLSGAEGSVARRLGARKGGSSSDLLGGRLSRRKTPAAVRAQPWGCVSTCGSRSQPAWRSR